MHLLPMYWNIAMTIMLIPLEIPYFKKWWHKYTGSELTFLDLMTWLGAIVSTYQYKLFNHGKAPFSNIDIKYITSKRKFKSSV